MINLKLKKYLIITITIVLLLPTFVNAENVKSITIKGNERISDETIKVFSLVKVGDEINNDKFNEILKNLYETNFFENVKVNYENFELTITVLESPIINKVIFEGIKSKTLKDSITKNILLKSRSSYNEYQVNKDRLEIIKELKNRGYYYSKIEVLKDIKENNSLDLIYKINIGDKAKIKKITFTGNKIFKDTKLKSIIISEEYKFWKFISGKKYLNENIISIDNRLLKNFYLNQGYLNIEINSSFAKTVDQKSFELIYNINANERIFFNKLSLHLPKDFDESNYKKINNLFDNIKGKPYSINRIEKILKKINNISLYEQFISTEALVEEKVNQNQIDLKFIIKLTEPIYVEKINIFGNNITKEAVIRNQMEFDEGDPYNDILFTRSINNLKNLNFFKDIKTDILENTENKTKTININLEEKPTGEIMAGAGVGTSGTTTTFGVRENNYLGNGLSLDANLDVSQETIKGRFSLRNPNFNNSDKSIYTNLQSFETDRLTEFGYKTNKTGITLGTDFEYYDDLILGLGFNTYYENIETDSSASSQQQKLKGNYFDNFISLSFDYDKRNQKFQTSQGFRNYFSTDLPLISETNTLANTFIATNYYEYINNNILKTSFYFRNANSLTGENVKLSERLSLPSSRLRGFERGKVGPKDGEDYIGGNFVTTANLTTTLPQILSNIQEVDFVMFLDAANIWGVDYDSSIDDDGSIRSSVGVGIDWMTPIGPLNFIFAQPITKESSDKVQTFRFNIGTTF